MKPADGGGRSRPLKACCLVSEILEEAGLDRERTRALRRQVLQGVIMLCQWQLERMQEHAPAPETPGSAAPDAGGARSSRARKIRID